MGRTYRTDEVARIVSPDDAVFYRLQLSADGGASTKHLNLTREEVLELAAILYRNDTRA